MKTLSKLAIALVAATVSFSALADQADVKVSASVLGNCRIVETNDINFGALDPAQATDQTASGSIVFACTSQADYTMTADKGQHFDQATGKRQMNQGTQNLPYALVKDSFTGQAQGFSTPMTLGLNATVFGSDYRDLPALSYNDVLRVTLLP